MSLSSPEKATRKSKRVEGESMLVSTEVSKTRRGTSYGGSPLSSAEKATRKSKRVEGESMLASIEASKTRRGTSYGSPLSSPKKVDGGSTLS